MTRVQSLYPRAIRDVSICPSCMLWDPPFSTPSPCSFPGALEDYANPPLGGYPSLRPGPDSEGWSWAGEGLTWHGKWAEDRVSWATAPQTSAEQVS